MRLHLSDPAATADLGEYLRTRAGAVVDRPGRNELEVSLIGSYAERAMREELERAVGRWRFVRRRPECVIEIR